MAKRRRIAIACQGGGSQCAFIAGALNTFFKEGVERRFRIVGLSGTSGGALTAALAWAGLLERAHGSQASIGDPIIDFWSDLSARTPQEMFLDGFVLQCERLAQRGLLPMLATSPSSPQFKLGSHLISSIIRRHEFTDLRALLEKHLNLADLPSSVDPDSPVLLVGAADVLEGKFKVFSSARNEITIDALLASAAIPTLFPAVWVDGHAYWDGIFSSNPPIFAFLQKSLMNRHALPDEIWILQVNRPEHDFVPELPDDIFDRRNHLAGNLSLQHELQVIDMVNLLIQEHALTDRFRARFGVDLTEPISVRFVRMSEALQRGLDYPSKLSRLPGHIARLIADGEAQAKRFLQGLGEAETRPEPIIEGPSLGVH